LRRTFQGTGPLRHWLYRIARGEQRPAASPGYSLSVADFFATGPADGRLDLIRLVVTGANRHPAPAAYLPDGSTGDCRSHGIMVFNIADHGIRHDHRVPGPGPVPGLRPFRHSAVVIVIRLTPSRGRAV